MTLHLEHQQAEDMLAASWTLIAQADELIRAARFNDPASAGNAADWHRAVHEMMDRKFPKAGEGA